MDYNLSKKYGAKSIQFTSYQTAQWEFISILFILYLRRYRSVQVAHSIQYSHHRINLCYIRTKIAVDLTGI